jgi:hypothetical protein
MATISKPAGKTKTVPVGAVGAGYGAIPPTHNLPGYVGVSAPLSVGQFYTTNTTAGQFLTSGANGTSWTNTTSIADNVMIARNNPAELEVKGRMVINGRDLEERLTTIETVLQIPERDVKLEKKHPKLKKLFDEYIHTLAKYRTFDAIKGDDSE